MFRHEHVVKWPDYISRIENGNNQTDKAGLSIKKLSKVCSSWPELVWLSFKCIKKNY